MFPSVPIYLLTGTLAVIATSAATVLVSRQLSAPNATLLLCICLLLLGMATSQLLITVPSPVRTAVTEMTGLQLPSDYWAASALAFGLPLDGLWLLFAVGYTGRGNRLRRQVAAFVAALVTFSYVAAAYAVVQVDASQSPDFTISATLFTGLFFLSQLASLGSLLVLEATLRRNTVSLTEGMSLAFGSFLFIYAPAVGVNLNRPVVIQTLVFGAATLLIIAVTENSVFDTLPAARIAARDRLVDDINEAVLLVDKQARVVDLNPTAERLFDVTYNEADRQQLSEVIPDAPAPAEVAAMTDPFRIQVDRTRLEVTATEVAGEYTDSVGYLLVCRDVTEQRRRERRLRILTQFLAGTVAERTATVARQADQLTDESNLANNSHLSGDDNSATVLAGEIRRTTESLKRFVSTARRIERSLSDHDGGPSDLVAVTREVASERAHVSLTVENGDRATAPVDPTVLRAVLDLLVAERLEQGADTIEITVRSSQEHKPSILLHPSSAAARDTHLTNSSGQHDNTEAEQAPTADPIRALCRLAIEHANGDIERLHDNCLHIVFRTDSSTAPEATSADAVSSARSSQDHPNRVEHSGEQS